MKVYEGSDAPGGMGGVGFADVWRPASGYARTSWTYLWGVRMTLGDYRARQPGKVRGQRLPSTPSEGWCSNR
jgi:hypothetical protein